jgi:hypothetical protein
MALYKMTHTHNGKIISNCFERLPAEIGRWQQAKDMDKRDNIQTRIYTQKTRNDLNRIVKKSVSKFPNGEEVIYDLVENSHKKQKEQ